MSSMLRDPSGAFMIYNPTNQRNFIQFFFFFKEVFLEVVYFTNELFVNICSLKSITTVVCYMPRRF